MLRVSTVRRFQLVSGSSAVAVTITTGRLNRCMASYCWLWSCAAPAVTLAARWCSTNATTSSAGTTSEPTTTTRGGTAADRPTTTFTTKVEAPTSCVGWRELAQSLLPNQTVSVDGALYNQIECIARALQFDAHDADGWYELGTAIVGGATPGVNSAVGSFHKCVQLKPDHAAAWLALGSVMTDFEVALIKDMPTSKLDCFEKATALEPSNPLNWMCLGTYLDGRPADRLTPLPGAAASTAGLAHVDGTSYTALECYLKVLELDPERYPAWNNVALGLIARSGGRGSTVQTVTVAGIQYTPKACFVKAIELDHTHGFVWRNLAACIDPQYPDEKITIRGKEFGREELLAVAEYYEDKETEYDPRR